MTTKGKIKVIKKGEVRNSAKARVRGDNSPKHQVREMVGNVTNWVSEFQQRKSDEAKNAFEQLFGQRPQTTGA